MVFEDSQYRSNLYIFRVWDLLISFRAGGMSGRKRKSVPIAAVMRHWPPSVGFDEVANPSCLIHAPAVHMPSNTHLVRKRFLGRILRMRLTSRGLCEPDNERIDPSRFRLPMLAWFGELP